MNKYMFCFGTRPEAIKMAPVILEFRKRKLNYFVCVTAQHREMLDQVLDWFEIKADYDLDLMEKSQSLNSLTAKIYSSIDPILEKENPKVVLIQGDTTTALATAMAAFHRNIEVAHIEAGLRTYNFAEPFPEEMNRQIISKLANYHFTPTELATNNLIDESISSDAILKTGNTIVDALNWSIHKMSNGFDNQFINLWSSKLQKSNPWILVTAHRRENIGIGLKNLSLAILELANNQGCNIIWPVHPNPCISTAIIDEVKMQNNIHLIEPLDYPSMIWLLQHVTLIISDSGGIQEEAPSFGVPVLVTRESTERPEGVNAGTSILVGMDKGNILKNVKLILAESRTKLKYNPFGDGHASERILTFLESLNLN